MSSSLELPYVSNIERAQKPKRLPVVFTRDEVNRLLAHLEGLHWLLAGLLYGSGLRLMECLRLRVKDIDFTYGQVTVRDGKGERPDHYASGKTEATADATSSEGKNLPR